MQRAAGQGNWAQHFCRRCFTGMNTAIQFITPTPNHGSRPGRGQVRSAEPRKENRCLACYYSIPCTVSSRFPPPQTMLGSLSEPVRTGTIPYPDEHLSIDQCKAGRGYLVKVPVIEREGGTRRMGFGATGREGWVIDNAQSIRGTMLLSSDIIGVFPPRRPLAKRTRSHRE